MGALPGCFYFDAINERPAVVIENMDSEEKHRGDTVDLRAIARDPEGDAMTFSWSARACLDAAADEEHNGCDEEPFATGEMDTFSFVIPFMLKDRPLQNESMLVTLTAEDEYRAKSLPRAELVVPIVDRIPIVVADKFSDYSFVEGTPIELFAKVTDDDNTPEQLAIVWDVDPPNLESHTIVDADPAVRPDPEVPNTVHYGKVLTANGVGEWSVTVTATDPLPSENTASSTVTINVVPDGPPCLRQLSPTIPPVGAAMPLSAPTLFRVPRVEDDLDRYPLVPNDPIFRAPTFRWSLKGPGQSAHAVVANAAGNTFLLDPASYTAGDIVELRVQIYDRKATPLPCVDGELTCSTISDDTCLQRQTWRVEIR